MPDRPRVLDPDLRSPALAYVDPPPLLTRTAFGIAGVFVVLAVVLLAVPWRQSAIGTGRVIAYAPADRQQSVEAPVDGRLFDWRVGEGTPVRAGDPLVEIVDNDPELVRRLEAQSDALSRERTAVQGQIDSYSSKIDALAASRELVAAEYDSKLAELAQKRVADEAEVFTAEANLNRVSALRDEGIASQRELELAQLGDRGSRASLEARTAEIRAVRQTRGKAIAEVETKIASARAELQVAESKLAEVDRKLLDLEVARSRQAQQLVTAPRDGVVLRLYGGPGGGQVKKGDPLLTLVPDAESRAAELWIDGNDMPLVARGETVRLVFEGWPALQVVGLPGASEGTFAGRVDFIDATDDGSGRFRVVVVPDPEQADWPDSDVLRQGVRAKGWMLLGRVSLGYELWRQLNGFPPLPSVEKGRGVPLPSAKKPRAPKALSP